MAAANDDNIIQKLERVAAEGMPGGNLTAERVQMLLDWIPAVLENYEQVHSTENFLSDNFTALHMKRVEFAIVRFASLVSGVVTDATMKDDGAEASAELKTLVARRNYLIGQDWDANEAVLREKLQHCDQKLVRLDPNHSMDMEYIRYYTAVRDFFIKQYHSFKRSCEEEMVRVDEKLSDVDPASLPDCALRAI